jgi:hypothetical protein
MTEVQTEMPEDAENDLSEPKVKKFKQKANTWDKLASVVKEAKVVKGLHKQSMNQLR